MCRKIDPIGLSHFQLVFHEFEISAGLAFLVFGFLILSVEEKLVEIGFEVTESFTDLNFDDFEVLRQGWNLEELLPRLPFKFDCSPMIKFLIF